MCRRSATGCLIKSRTATERAANGMAERLAIVRDPWNRRERRHALVTVLSTAWLRR